jgi:proline iminopeptidase
MGHRLRDSAHAHERARQLFVADLLPNHAVNRQLGADAGRWVEHEAMAARLAEMDTPTLIVHGEADPRPVWAARRLAGSILHARLRTLPAVGHLPWLEQPDQFDAILREFITALPPGASAMQ